MAHPVRSGMVSASPRTKLSSLPTLIVDMMSYVISGESIMQKLFLSFPYAFGLDHRSGFRHITCPGQAPTPGVVTCKCPWSER